MSFEEFIFLTRKLLGPPRSGSCWRCPYCGSRGPSFSVRPPQGEYPIKFKCHRCDAWGDAADLLRHFFPQDDYSARLDRLAELHAEFEAGGGDTDMSFPSGDRGETREPQAADPRALEVAFADLIDFLAKPVPGWATTGNLAMLRLLAHACNIAMRNGTTLDELASYVARHLLSYREALREHVATCTDDSCGEACRRERARRAVKMNGRAESCL